MKRRSIGGLSLLALVAGTVACVAGTADNTQLTGAQPGPPRAIEISPMEATVDLGGSQQFKAVVVDQNGNTVANQAVVWSIAPTGGPFAITDSGVVHACYPGGRATITAASAADPNITGTAAAITGPNPPVAAEIDAITRAGTTDTVPVDSLTGSVDVTGRADPNGAPCYPVASVDLVLNGPTGDTVVDHENLSGVGTATNIPVNLTFHSDAKLSGAYVFPNNVYMLSLNVHYTGYSGTRSGSGVSITLANP